MKLFYKLHNAEYIIIAGCGRLGAGLAKRLSLQKKNVIVIDEKEDAFRKLPSSYSGLTMCADVKDITKLEETGIKQADIFITVTDNDNINIMAAQMAKEIYKVEHVLTRIYDEEKLVLLKNSGIETFCPTELSEKEINRFMNW